MKKVEVDHRATKPSSSYFRESEKGFILDDEQTQIEAVIQTSLDYQWQLEKVARYELILGRQLMRADQAYGALQQSLNHSLRGHPQLESPLVEPPTVLYPYWKYLAVERSPLKGFQHKPLSTIWIHTSFLIEIRSNRGLILY